MGPIELKIAVISDLHCRHGKEKLISTHLYTESPRSPKEHHPVESLKQLISKQSLHADILLCPGDITDRADQQGLSTGWEIIKEISNELKVSFFTSSVGNHDVNSRSEDINPFQYLTSFRDDFPVSIEDLRSSFWSLDKNFFLYQKNEYLILNYNSAFNHLDANRAKHSIITDAILEKMREELDKCDTSKKVKIALFHHHPKAFANIDEFYKDGDVIERGDLLLKLLLEYNFDIVIHGHKHLPRLEYHVTGLPIFCAGSFSSLMNIMDVSGKNTFHLITLVKENNQSHGNILTWEFTKGYGWLPAESKVFFPWTTGFGYNDHIEQLEQRIVQYFDTANSQLLAFETLVQNIPEVKQLIPTQQNQLTHSLLTNHKLEFIPNLMLGPRVLTKQIQ